MAAAVLLSARDITIRLGDRRVFASTTWTIHHAENWAILGPTGSGKSTLAKAISRELPLVAGQIAYFFDGPGNPQGRSYHYPHEILTFSAETHRQFLRRFSEYHQARWQSFEGEDAPAVADLLSPAAVFRTSPFEIAAPPDTGAFARQQAEVAALFGLDALWDRKMHQLSHGESRKVFLARLLLRGPKLLILDDPFTGLDEASRVRFHAAVERLLQAQQPAVVLVCPRVEELPAGISHCLVVEDMKVQRMGPRQEILAACSLPADSGLSQAVPHPESTLAMRKMLNNYTAALERAALPAHVPLVQMSAVSVAYQGVAVLQGVDWTVRAGERWALRGPNGAGKTTLLSLVLADNPQGYRSDISLFGRPRGSGESIWEIKRRIGWVSPELHIFYEKTISSLAVVSSGFYDSVGLYHACTPQQARESRDWMRALEIEPLAHLPFQGLSAGQQRLVLLARALVKEPPLLILDEPCQGLDEEHRRFFIGLVDRLCQHAPLTLIYVTHYREELPASITHQLVLERGRVSQSGRVP